ncbi:type IV secretion system DNA-binding domain-containing protein [Bradyrhizobium diazoefficiens]|uniref:type IV secretory system conjugative DNA transfer family protein n=1 Tax=Bradyrhizobium diazoefficiens TaxID=1355477 RepID=UPI0019099BAB|nr:type IV secretion system DNA-binding domain-containing protein [Bradyrhizobium diazoefficiens]MBK3666197.1 type IV secretion system DNA-binding domain-containing protein [Bradyrhizobium diazoefficiens]
MSDILNILAIIFLLPIALIRAIFKAVVLLYDFVLDIYHSSVGHSEVRPNHLAEAEKRTKELQALTAASAATASIPTSDEAISLWIDRFHQRFHSAMGRYPPGPLATEIGATFVNYYRDEGFDSLPEFNPAWSPLEQARYRDRLIAFQKKLANPQLVLDAICTSVINSALIFCMELGKQYLVNENTTRSPPSPFSVRAIDVLRNPSKVMSLVASPVVAPELIELDAMQTVRAQVLANQAAKEDITKHTLYDRWFHVDFPFYLFDTPRFSGTWIVAPQGRGKTTLLHALIDQDLQKDACVILMDSKGDLIEPFYDRPELRGRTIVIDPKYPIGINPLDIPKTDINKTVELLEYIFEGLLQFKFTPTQQYLFRRVIRAVITVFPNPTLDTVRNILMWDSKHFADYIEKMEPDLQDFFRKDYESENIRGRRREVIQRISLLLEDDAMRAMLTATKTDFQIDKAMDSRTLVLIKNTKDILGDKGAEFFGRFFVAQVLAGAQRRSGRKRQQKNPVFFYIDECQSVISEDEKVPTIIQECRSQNIALTLAHQNTTQIQSERVLAALQNCAIRIANSDQEAKALAPSLRTTPEEMHALRRGEFIMYVRDVVKSGIKVRVTMADLDKYGEPDSFEPPPSDDEPIVKLNPRPEEMEAWRLDSADKRPEDDERHW